MSSHHHLHPRAPKGEVEHINVLSEHIGALYLNDGYSDVVLSVGGEKFHGHKAILAARSEYFRALLFGGMKESNQSEIELKGTSLAAFKGLLKYVYTGHLSLANLKEDLILDYLGLANQYGFVDLEASISDYLRQILDIDNVCMIFDTAKLYQLQFLIAPCFSFMDKHSLEITHHESFLQLSPTSLKELVSRDSFYAPEVEIFAAVCSWVRHNPDYDMNDILSVVRLPLMSLDELLKVVRPTKLISPDAILDAIDARAALKEKQLRYRGFLMPEENVADTSQGTQVLKGEMRTSLLDGDITTYDMEKGYTRHAIGDHGIVIKLGKQVIVNHIKMLLWDRDSRSYSYYIEVSVDQEYWEKVVDHSNYLCRSWQFLYFPAQVVRYIRVVGTFNTANKVFHVVSFEIKYTSTQVALEKGLVVPHENVAVLNKSATVIEGVSRIRDALLNGNTENYNWDSGYTCHQLGSGAIVVQLGQPYMIGSMRLLLWDCDDRLYSYYVEVSVNNTKWEVVVDKTRERCRSWQILKFEPRPVVFIRIMGTHNTANEVFHCVHFECPSQVDDQPANKPTSGQNAEGSRSAGQENVRTVTIAVSPPQPDIQLAHQDSSIAETQIKTETSH